jgi:glycerol kinase
MAYVLALDQGTTSCRAFLFDEEGRVAGLGQREFRQFYPRPGWVEHDPEQIWQVQLSVAREAIEGARIRGRDVAAIGITNQRETTVVWDRGTGEPVHPAIVWQDRRTAEECRQLREAGHADWIQERTGLVIDPYFSGTKLTWILDHVPGARERAERGDLAFGTIDSWLVWKLTGGRVHATDVSNASRSLLYNLRTESWDRDLLDRFRVPPSLLPEVRASSGRFGEAEVGHFGSSIPITGIAGDQQAALFGQLCHQEGAAKNTYGTGCFLLLNTGERAVPSRHRLLTTVAWKLEGQPTQYALEGSVFVGGAAVQWLRDGLGIIGHAGEVERLAASTPDNGGVYFVPAFAGLGSPYWDPYARGTLLGITRGTTSAQIARATLEAIAHQCVDLIEAMNADVAGSGSAGGDGSTPSRTLRQLRVDGGAAANDLLLQIQADLAGVPVVRPKQLETTVLGAAYLAGLAVGIWPEPSVLSAHFGVDRTFEPKATLDRTGAERETWKRAVERASGWTRS